MEFDSTFLAKFTSSLVAVNSIYKDKIVLLLEEKKEFNFYEFYYLEKYITAFLFAKSIKTPETK